jgi:hypothetical protein
VEEDGELLGIYEFVEDCVGVFVKELVGVCEDV